MSNFTTYEYYVSFPLILTNWMNRPHWQTISIAHSSGLLSWHWQPSTNVTEAIATTALSSSITPETRQALEDAIPIITDISSHHQQLRRRCDRHRASRVSDHFWTQCLLLDRRFRQGRLTEGWQVQEFPTQHIGSEWFSPSAVSLFHPYILDPETHQCA